MTFPDGRDTEAIVAAYGDPARFGFKPAGQRFPDAAYLQEAAWKREILAPLPVPFPAPVRFSGGQALARQVYVHKAVHDSLAAIMAELATSDAWRHVRDYAGCFAYRTRKGDPNRLSLHSWAVALDFNAERYPYGAPADPKDPFVLQVVPAFEDAGWTWGGRWRTPDAMHFQAAVE